MFLQTFIAMGTIKPALTVADIVRAYGAEYRRRYPLTAEQERVLWAIAHCRTAALGGYIERCDVCGKFRIRYCSCQNRHCATCGAFEKAQWLAKQKVWQLPIPYYHVVFTTDHAINALAWANPAVIYDLLFATASQLLTEYGQRYLGGRIGFTAVLHTWGQDLGTHIHLHCLVTGGALQQTQQGARWQPSGKKFLFPVVKLARDFRARFCARLLRLHQAGKLQLVGPAAGLDVPALVAQLQGKNWTVFIQEAGGGLERLCEYLGRYIYRIAISNHRLVRLADGQVSFTYYDNKDGGQQKVLTLDAVEFLRRFLQHVLPPRYVRVRHYGLHHSSQRGLLRQCRALLGLPGVLPTVARLGLSEWVASFAGQDPSVCPFCGQGRLVPYREFGPVGAIQAAVLGVLGVPARGAVVG